MISMYRKKLILNYHIKDGYGAKRIIKVMKQRGEKPASRGVIRRLINTYDRILRTYGKDAAMAYFDREEVFHTPERPRTKLDDKACKYIEDCLERNRQKIAEGNRKQCMDLTRVWQVLREDMGYDMCYATVTAYAREYAARQEPSKSHECFIRQYHPAGEECQFDWGDVKLKIRGRKLTVRMAVFTLPHSNHRTAYLFLREHTLAFMESHRNYFHDIGRIPKRMVYDNMRVAVKVRRMWTTDDKEPTDALLAMSSFYGFDFRFCNARSGNEKGNVEESVKFVRKYVFSVRDEFDSLEEAQNYLSAGCTKLNAQSNSPATADIISLAKEDFDAMRPWTDDIACFQMVEREVTNYATISVDRANYSVPDAFTLGTVRVRIYTNKIEILDAGGKVVAEHAKVAHGGWSIKLEHYLHTLRYKPGALKNAEALRQAPDGIRKVFTGAFSGNPKDFVELLIFAKEKNIVYDDIVEAYNSLKESHVHNITLQLMEDKLQPANAPKAISLAGIQQDGKAIEENAENGLLAVARLMNNPTNTISYATGR